MATAIITNSVVAHRLINGGCRSRYRGTLSGSSGRTTAHRSGWLNCRSGDCHACRRAFPGYFVAAAMKLRPLANEERDEEEEEDCSEEEVAMKSIIKGVPDDSEESVAEVDDGRMNASSSKYADLESSLNTLCSFCAGNVAMARMMGKSVDDDNKPGALEGCLNCSMGRSIEILRSIEMSYFREPLPPSCFSGLSALIKSIFRALLSALSGKNRLKDKPKKNSKSDGRSKNEVAASALPPPADSAAAAAALPTDSDQSEDLKHKHRKEEPLSQTLMDSATEASGGHRLKNQQQRATKDIERSCQKRNYYHIGSGLRKTRLRSATHPSGARSSPPGCINAIQGTTRATSRRNQRRHSSVVVDEPIPEEGSILDVEKSLGSSFAMSPPGKRDGTTRRINSKPATIPGYFNSAASFDKKGGDHNGHHELSNYPRLNADRQWQRTQLASADPLLKPSIREIYRDASLSGIHDEPCLQSVSDSLELPDTYTGKFLLEDPDPGARTLQEAILPASRDVPHSYASSSLPTNLALSQVSSIEFGGARAKTPTPTPTTSKKSKRKSREQQRWNGISRTTSLTLPLSPPSFSSPPRRTRSSSPLPSPPSSSSSSSSSLSSSPKPHQSVLDLAQEESLYQEEDDHHMSISESISLSYSFNSNCGSPLPCGSPFLQCRRSTSNGAAVGATSSPLTDERAIAKITRPDIKVIRALDTPSLNRQWSQFSDLDSNRNSAADWCDDLQRCILRRPSSSVMDEGRCPDSICTHALNDHEGDSSQRRPRPQPPDRTHAGSSHSRDLFLQSTTSDSAGVASPIQGGVFKNNGEQVPPSGQIYEPEKPEMLIALSFPSHLHLDQLSIHSGSSSLESPNPTPSAGVSDLDGGEDNDAEDAPPPSRISPSPSPSSAPQATDAMAAADNDDGDGVVDSFVIVDISAVTALRTDGAVSEECRQVLEDPSNAWVVIELEQVEESWEVTPEQEQDQDSNIVPTSYHNTLTRPAEGQSLINYLVSQDFKTCAILEKENAHFHISEALIAAFESMSWDKIMRRTVSEQSSSSSDEEIQELRQRIRIRKKEKLIEKNRPFPSVSDAPTDISAQGMSPPGTPLSELSASEAEEDKEEQEQGIDFTMSSDAHGNLQAIKSWGLNLSMASLYSDAELSRSNQQIQRVSSLDMSDGSAEKVAISLLKKFSEKHLPKASELKWLVSEVDAPQQLLPLPSSIPISPDDGDNANSARSTQTRLRGNLEWAPPRSQIIFSVHPSEKRSVVMARQNYRCAGCGIRVEPAFMKRYRYCDYLGKYFCQCCHRRQTSTIPGRVIDKWDFTGYPVSMFSGSLLDKMWSEPLFHIDSINPALYKRVRALDAIKMGRQQLHHLYSLFEVCKRDSRLVAELQKMPAHWINNDNVYSMEDFTLVKNSTMLATINAFVVSAYSHVKQCQLCQGLGFICGLCENKNVIFPFQLNSVASCEVCHSCYHRKCFAKENKCPKCIRIACRRKQLAEVDSSLASPSSESVDSQEGMAATRKADDS